MSQCMLLLQLLNDESITGQLRKECKLFYQPTRYEWRVSGGYQRWFTSIIPQIYTIFSV
jgi:hypothetical protein